MSGLDNLGDVFSLDDLLDGVQFLSHEEYQNYLEEAVTFKLSAYQTD